MLQGIFLFIHTFFFLVISSNVHRYFKNFFHEFKVLKKVITIETFNEDFYDKFIKFWIICFFKFSSYCRIYFLIYTYIYIHSLAHTDTNSRIHTNTSLKNLCFFITVHFRIYIYREREREREKEKETTTKIRQDNNLENKV